MIVLRLLGAVFFLISMIALIYDGTRMLGSEAGLDFTALGEHWFKLHPTSLNLAQAAIERHVSPFLWDPIIITILEAPAWVVFAILGFIFYMLGRRRKKPDIYAN